MLRILLSTTTSSFKAYIEKEWFAHIQELIVPEGCELDFMFVDNSPDPSYMQRYIEYLEKHNGRVTILYHRPKSKNIREIMAGGDEMIRKYVIDHGYDFLFRLEEDVFPPYDVLQRLLRHKKLVISAPYFTGEKEQSYIIAAKYVPVLIYKGRMITIATLLTQRESFDMWDGKLHEISGTGQGCILLHRSVLEKIKFRYDPKFPEAHADTNLHLDLWYKRIPSYLDTSFICYHFNSNWLPILTKHNLHQ